MQPELSPSCSWVHHLKWGIRFKTPTLLTTHLAWQSAMAISVPLMTTTSIQSFAQERQAEDTVEKVIVTGTRMMNRSAADSPVPVDINIEALLFQILPC